MHMRKKWHFYDIGKDPKLDEGRPGVVAEVTAPQPLPPLLSSQKTQTLKDGPVKTKVGETQAYLSVN